MSQQNIEVVKRGYEAFSAGDVETVMSVFDDNLEWVQPGESTISGIYRGKGEFGEYLRRSHRAIWHGSWWSDRFQILLADSTARAQP